MLASLTSELDRLSPRFEVQPTQIEILSTPSEFYEALKTKISTAKRRVYLSTLYIGKTEHELISVIRDALQRNPDLKVSFLTDALRGTRETPNPSCASLLAPLVEDFGAGRVEIRMFHTPNLFGVRKKLLPRRINEGWGLQHMKLYGVDDELIMSGANLSNDYFTNRQDRYHVFSSAEITDYFFRIHSAISNLSYLISPSPSSPGGYTMTWPTSNAGPSPLDDRNTFKKAASDLLTPLIRPAATPLPSSPTSTLIYPLLQFTSVLPPANDTSTELPAMTSLLTHLTRPAHAGSAWTFTAGYFNMTPWMRSLLLATDPVRGTVVAAAPQANGFYGSAGVSGMLPAAYTLLARRFLQAVAAVDGLAHRVRLLEWRRGTVGEPDGWTYHAKGFWVTLPGETETGSGGNKQVDASSPSSSSPTSERSSEQQQQQQQSGPSIAIIGSSNYTKRSYELDLEAGAMIVTRDVDLRRRLGAEEARLARGEWAREVGMGEFERTERRVGLHVRIAMWIVTILGGAL
ncbi:cdp-diacylglycerol-glycerol-3-phosphate 3-phosphatidyltransferase [Diplodia corticola]|uniref:CDP-diacylglycerol--glycerol-3-phosphate 3-phosphatidyltransferase n=1 Tax=Diplodia corticola TaxID=236234 RepID=A0A1J9RBF6_9PEZI|nr:cdp-diacylglycerol-glycerol-3-phosphate 3-phosphatidyltransferase [Diplodia corticola]OJD38942.1 cdp-diacylglycerol-glycerol-3-phosphate 3-phosphatidyltransferase [Diplodia corticola]